MYTVHVYYALVGRAPVAYGSHHVCLSVCLSVCVCVILQCAFLQYVNELSNESSNATTAQHSTIAKLARFCFKALLSSYNMMCSPWWPLSAIKSPAKRELTITNYLSPWKLHLYYKMTTTLVKSREQARQSLKPWLRYAACIVIDDDVLVWHTPKLCTCSLYY